MAQSKIRRFGPVVRVPLLHDVGIELFKNARDRGGQRGVNFQEGLRQVVHALDVSYRNPVKQICVRSNPLIHVRERQKTYRRVGRNHSIWLDRSFLIRAEIIVREHHSLWLARRAGGIDDGGKLVGGHASGSESVFCNRSVSSRGHQGFEAEDILAEIGWRGSADDVLYRREPAAALKQTPRLHLSRDNDYLDA